MTSYIVAAIRQAVRHRAADRCEYCLIHEADTFFPHEADHVIAEKHAGDTTVENLALACMFCNRHKGSDIASIDPESGEIVPLFNPRRQRWEDHFDLDGPQIVRRTPEARATARLLQLNHPDRLVERSALQAADRYPERD